MIGQECSKWEEKKKKKSVFSWSFHYSGKNTDPKKEYRSKISICQVVISAGKKAKAQIKSWRMTGVKKTCAFIF